MHRWFAPARRRRNRLRKVQSRFPTGDGVDALWDELARHERYLEKDGALQRLRADRLEREFQVVLAARIRSEVDRLRARGDFAGLARAVADHSLDPYDAAEQLLGAVYGVEAGD